MEQNQFDVSTFPPPRASVSRYSSKQNTFICRTSTVAAFAPRKQKCYMIRRSMFGLKCEAVDKNGEKCKDRHY